MEHQLHADAELSTGLWQEQDRPGPALLEMTQTKVSHQDIQEAGPCSGHVVGGGWGVGRSTSTHDGVCSPGRATLHIKVVPGTTVMESFTKHLLGAGLVAREAAG